MKSYEEIINIVQVNRIVYDRSYSIDQYVYVHFKTTPDALTIDKFRKLFNNPDTFTLYNCICIDMNEQPGEGKHYDQNTLRSKVKMKRERLKEIQEFSLDDAELKGAIKCADEIEKNVNKGLFN